MKGECEGATLLRTRVANYIEKHPDLLDGADVIDKQQYINFFRQGFTSVTDVEVKAAGLMLKVKTHTVLFGKVGSKADVRSRQESNGFNLAPAWKFTNCADHWMPVSPFMTSPSPLASASIWPSTCDEDE